MNQQPKKMAIRSPSHLVQSKKAQRHHSLELGLCRAQRGERERREIASSSPGQQRRNSAEVDLGRSPFLFEKGGRRREWGQEVERGGGGGFGSQEEEGEREREREKGA